MSFEEDDFHEAQRARDCSVHSLNNACGRKVVDPEEVVEQIKRRVDAFEEEAGRLGFENAKKEAAAYRRSLADGKTYFTAEAVWSAAASLGRCPMPLRIENPFVASVNASMFEPSPEMLDAASKGSLIVLGRTKKGTYHAIAVRDSKIRDSLASPDVAENPPAMNAESLAAIYSEIFGVYALS